MSTEAGQRQLTAQRLRTTPRRHCHLRRGDLSERPATPAAYRAIITARPAQDCAAVPAQCGQRSELAPAESEASPPQHRQGHPRRQPIRLDLNQTERFRHVKTSMVPFRADNHLTHEDPEDGSLRHDRRHPPIAHGDETSGAAHRSNVAGITGCSAWAVPGLPLRSAGRDSPCEYVALGRSHLSGEVSLKR